MTIAFRLLPPMLLLACLAGCGERGAAGEASSAASKDGGPASPASLDPAAAAAAVKAPPMPELGSFRIASLLLGTELDADQVVREDRERFAPDDRIHASLLSIGEHPGLRLSAVWVAPDGSTIARSEQPIAPRGATATTFSLANPKPWPPGEYQLLLAINGHPIQGRSFEVTP